MRNQRLAVCLPFLVWRCTAVTRLLMLVIGIQSWPLKISPCHGTSNHAVGVSLIVQAHSYMDVPTTVKQLVNQRIRWAIGSMDVVTAYWLKFLTHPWWRRSRWFSCCWITSFQPFGHYFGWLQWSSHSSIFLWISHGRSFTSSQRWLRFGYFQFIFGMLQLKLSLN